MGQNVKNKQVAVICDNTGKCKYVGKVKLVDDPTYNKYVNEAKEIDESSKRKKYEIYKKIVNLETEINKLKEEIKILKGEE